MDIQILKVFLDNSQYHMTVKYLPLANTEADKQTCPSR